jgi:N-acetylmuramoyl-L-alanine amidase
MRDIDRIIIHCAATPNGRYHTAADIDQWHKERGWTGIGYHWVIKTDGVVEAGRDEEEVGAHAAGYNENSIGVCLIGTDKFSIEQWDALAACIEDLISRYDASILGHNELPAVNKACPGFSVAKWVENGFIPEPENVL